MSLEHFPGIKSAVQGSAKGPWAAAKVCLRRGGIECRGSMLWRPTREETLNGVSKPVQKKKRNEEPEGSYDAIENKSTCKHKKPGMESSEARTLRCGQGNKTLGTGHTNHALSAMNTQRLKALVIAAPLIK